MNQIPPKLKEDMAADPFYLRCCVTGAYAKNTKIDWHHNLIFAGRQVQEKFAILPLAKAVHDDIVQHKEYCDWIMLNRATESELKAYSKAENLIAKRDRLNKTYGVWKSV